MPKTAGSGDPQIDKFRYVDTSLDAMLQEFRTRGVPADRLDIKLFGGANVLSTLSKENAIGSLNWQQAKRSMEKLSLELTAHDIGGETGRRLVFETVSGNVLVKRLRAATTERGIPHGDKA
jgi:chemotaxis protein CheD